MEAEDEKRTANCRRNCVEHIEIPEHVEREDDKRAKSSTNSRRYCIEPIDVSKDVEEDEKKTASSTNCRRYCVQPIAVHTVINNINTYNNKPKSDTSRKEQETCFNDLTDDNPSAVSTQPLKASYRSTSSVWHTASSSQQPTEQQPVEESRRDRPRPVEYVDSDQPTATLCYNCKQMVVTYLYYQSGHLTYLACIICAVSGCDLGCCLLPFCIDQLKDKIHKCPQCHVVLGKYKFI